MPKIEFERFPSVNSKKKMAASASATNTTESGNEVAATPEPHVDSSLGVTTTDAFFDQQSIKAHQHVDKKMIGPEMALMNIIKANIGTGILALPSVLLYAGFVMGSVMIVLMGLLATYITHIQMTVAKSLIDNHGLDRKKMDYTETVFQAIKYAGPVGLRKYKGKFKHLTNFFLLLTQFGFCCVYILFVSQNTYCVIQAELPASKTPPLQVWHIGALFSLLLIPLVLIRTLRMMSPMMIVANITTAVGLILVFAYCLQHLTDFRAYPNVTDTKRFLIAFGIIIYSFEGISLVQPIENNLRKPEIYMTWNGIFNTAMTIVVVLYTSVAFFGFLCFGRLTKGSITLNIPSHPWWVLPVRPLFVLSILISYLIQFFVPAIIVERLMLKLDFYRNSTDRKRRIYANIMRVGFVLVTYAISQIVPYLDLMISLVGAVSSSMLAIVIPPFLQIVVNWRVDRAGLSRLQFWWQFTRNLLIILFGLVGFVGGLSSTIIELIQVANSDKKSDICGRF